MFRKLENHILEGIRVFYFNNIEVSTFVYNLFRSLIGFIQWFLLHATRTIELASERQNIFICFIDIHMGWGETQVKPGCSNCFGRGEVSFPGVLLEIWQWLNFLPLRTTLTKGLKLVPGLIISGLRSQNSHRGFIIHKPGSTNLIAVCDEMNVWTRGE